MAPDNSEILASLADLLHATDRQTEVGTQKINELRAEMRQATQETNARFEAIFDRFATAVADGFGRMEKKIDGVKEEVADLRHVVQQIDQRVARVDANQPTGAEVIRRLEVLENIVLNKAS